MTNTPAGQALKPCPFCNFAPNVVDGIDPGTQTERLGYGFICCENDICGVMPSVAYYNGFEQGAHVWNTRHTADIASSEVTGETSDGYHTFNELYEHRHALFIALLKAHPEKAWKSKKHRDGIMFDGWFIAGLETPDGQVTYHMPLHLWDDVEAEVIHVAPEWDGHTSNDVISRIKALTRPATAQVEKENK